MYDEAWLVNDLISSLVSPSSRNINICDLYIFHVDSESDYGYSKSDGYMPGPPHRDRPSSGPEAFRTSTLEGVEIKEPKYVSAWLALTAATTSNSCLYVMPRDDDEGYYGSSDDTSCLKRDYLKLIAQPLSAGDMLTFSHRLLHYGSKPLPDHGPDRVAFTSAFADKDFEVSYFDSHFLPFPPLGLRVGLTAGQSIQYEHLKSMDNHTVALFRRIFHSQKLYFEKISSAVQMIIFKNKQKKFSSKCLPILKIVAKKASSPLIFKNSGIEDLCDDGEISGLSQMFCGRY